MATKSKITARDARFVWRQLGRLFKNVGLVGVPLAIELRWDRKISKKNAIGYAVLDAGRLRIVFLESWWLNAPRRARQALILHEAAHVLCMLRGNPPGHGKTWWRSIQDLEPDKTAEVLA